MRFHVGHRALLLSTVSFLIVCTLVYLMYARCATRYSPLYSEEKFRALQVGMTVSEMERIIGTPISKTEWEDGTVLWAYSDRKDDTCDFERRWVLVRNGSIAAITNDYWEE
jgi:hypothetical protein